MSKLTGDGAADSTTLWGYLGPSRDDGMITLYPSLENLGDSIEFAKADILHIEDVPETILLFGAKAVWIRRDATVVRRRTDTAKTVGTSTTPAGEVTEEGQIGDGTHVRKGRLRMRMMPRAAAAYDCYSPCSTCHSECGVCISIPQ
ncbi:hypothetical protein ABZW11_07575 [Nonomuraea sp. NPDC004580]|uniref:hypothetical protein n=1 Tax=Nonomuraea sp. NPDC004580 TaxID=3154552 RepID=UPI0033B77294